MEIRALARKTLLEDLKWWWNSYKEEILYKRILKTFYMADMFSLIWDVATSISVFTSNIKRLMEYAPLVWKHRNWDHGFILRFNKKLYEDLYIGAITNGRHVVNKSMKRKLRTVINLLDRLEKDEYGDKLFDQLEKKYGKSKIDWIKVDDKPLYKMVNKRDEALTEEAKKQYKKDIKAIMKHEQYLRKQDLELLGKYITHYSDTWWD